MTCWGAPVLLDHPAVPATCVEIQGAALVGGRWTARERRLLAVQCLGAAATALDVDLWVGAGAVRSAHVIGHGDDVQLLLGRPPMRLGPVLARMGAGEGAFERACAALGALLSKTLGLKQPPEGAEGWGLDPWLELALAVVDSPLPPATARSLWGYELLPLPEPGAGEVQLWGVPVPSVARRLGGELVARLRARGRSAWLVSPGSEEEATAPYPAEGAAGVLVVAGVVTRSAVSAAERWAGRDNSAVVVAGSFPTGWRPPSPPVGEHRLILVGGSGAGRQQMLRGPMSGFFPYDPAQRSLVTASAARLFGEETAKSAETAAEPAERWLSLSADGLPEGFLLSAASVDEDRVRALQDGGRVIRVGDVWRSALPVNLRPDPEHLRIAQLYPADDPRRLLHEALGGAAWGSLNQWVRESVEDARFAEVRDLLARADPTCLDRRLRRALAESCLLELNPAAARDALSGVEDDAWFRPVIMWLEAVDRDSGWEPPSLTDLEPQRAPVAVAGVAAEALTVALRAGRGSAEAAASVLSQAMALLEGPLARWFELEKTWLESPDRLQDADWFCRVVGDHSRLRRRWLHLRGLVESSRGRPRAARRALRVLLQEGSGVLGPGWAGQVALDAGSVAIELRRTEEQALLHLKALRLLESAGFVRRTRAVHFNLAVLDLDGLRLDRAESRFRELSAGRRDPFVIAEMARLELARGNHQRMQETLGALSAAEANGQRMVEGVRFLRGVMAATEGRWVKAREDLSSAGEEGKVWMELIDAAQGTDSAGTGADEEGWGVRRAAEIIRVERADPGATESRWPSSDGMDGREALAVALACRFGRATVNPPEPVVRTAVRVLRERGMPGWAEFLAPAEDDEEVLAALASIGERGLAAFDAADTREPLLARLGISGLEVRALPAGSVIEVIGEGHPGVEMSGSRASLVPLGGKASNDALWRLLLTLLEPHLPTVQAPEGEIGNTGIVGTSGAMRSVREEIADLAPAGFPVMVLGETGVGKELVARGLHRLSQRQGRFVAINMAGLPDHLVESELFGVVRGAYTGADRSRDGLVRAADGGTLFLDEIGELDPRLQAKLLRFLETGEVRSVGADVSRWVDVRIVSATNREPAKMTTDGGFRQDLFYRLATAVITVPPLRDHLSDLPELQAKFEHDAVRRGDAPPATWSRAAREAMQTHSWPGNVRELRQVVFAAMARARGGTVQPGHLAFDTGEVPPLRTWDRVLRQTKVQLITDALQRCEGNRSAAARELGISRQTLLYHMRTLGIT